MSDIIYAQTGQRPKLIRFPGGSSNTVSLKYCSGIMTTLTKAVTDQGYKYFDWNVSSGDAGGTTSTEEVYQNVVNGIKSHNVSVVLQHDIKASVLTLLNVSSSGVLLTDIHFFHLQHQQKMFIMGLITKFDF